MSISWELEIKRQTLKEMITGDGEEGLLLFPGEDGRELADAHEPVRRMVGIEDRADDG